MNLEAQTVWAGLEFRKPAMLRIVEALSEEQLRWLPPNGRNSIAWQLWHIAEVEDNWVRDLAGTATAVSLRPLRPRGKPRALSRQGRAARLFPRGA